MTQNGDSQTPQPSITLVPEAANPPATDLIQQLEDLRARHARNFERAALFHIVTSIQDPGRNRPLRHRRTPARSRTTARGANSPFVLSIA